MNKLRSAMLDRAKAWKLLNTDNDHNDVPKSLRNNRAKWQGFLLGYPDFRRAVADCLPQSSDHPQRRSGIVNVLLITTNLLYGGVERWFSGLVQHADDDAVQWHLGVTDAVWIEPDVQAALKAARIPIYYGPS